MSVKVTVPNGSSDYLTFGSANTPTAAEVVGIDSGSSNGQLAFKTTASGTSTERMRIDTSGNVGIGTSSPLAKFDVNGSAYFGAFITTGTGVSTGGSALELGGLRTGDGTSYIDLHATSGSDYETRIQRVGGVDGSFVIANTGTGAFTIKQIGAGNLVFDTNNTERMRIDSSGNLSFNSGYGSAAIAYGCRAWAKFTSTTTPSISASGNIASVTYSATAQYTIAFTSAMPDANYAVVTGGNYNNAAGNYTYGTSIYSQSTTSFVIQTWTAGTPAVWNASGFVYFSVFR